MVQKYQQVRILARKVDSDNFQDAQCFLDNGGQKGRQSAFITTGSYRINTYLFEIVIAPQVVIFENMVGIVTAMDGEPIPIGQIAGKFIDGHNNFQDFDHVFKKWWESWITASSNVGRFLLYQYLGSSN